MRPSLATERQAVMLEALAECVAETGLDKLTVQAVADKCGWSRGHVRYYLGNKADQVLALVDLYSDRYASAMELAVDNAPEGARRQRVHDELFGEAWQNVNDGDDAVLDALTAYAAANPTSGVSLTPMYRRILAAIERALTERFSPEDAHRRAEVVLSLAYGQASMLRLDSVDTDASSEFAREVLGLTA